MQAVDTQATDQAEAEKAAALAAIKARIEAEINVHEANGLDYGGLLDFDFKIIECTFTRDANYNKGQTVVGVMRGENMETGAEVIQYWTVGKDMESEDDGRRVAPTKSGQKHWHASSQMGQIYHKVKEGEYGYDCALDLLPQNLMTSTPWEGTCWRMRAAKVEFTDGETKEKKSFQKSFPAEWLGRNAVAQQPVQQFQAVAVPGAQPVQQVQPVQQFQPVQQVQPVQVQPVQQAYVPQAVAPAAQTANPIIGLLNPAALPGLIGFAKGVDQNVFIAQAATFEPGIYQNPSLVSALTSGELQRLLQAQP